MYTCHSTTVPVKNNMRQLVVIAGGLGSRLTQQGVDTPKLLLSINGKTILEYLVEEAVVSNFDEILLILNHKSEIIKSFVDERSWSIKLRIEIEKRRLGTGGALIQARRLLNEIFTVVLGDLLILDCNLDGTYNYLKNSDLDALILLKYTDHPHDSDLVSLDREGKIVQLDCYPHDFIPKVPIAIAGVLHCRRNLIPTVIPTKEVDLFEDIVSSQVNRKVHGIFHQGIIRDVGNLERLQQYNSFLWDSSVFKRYEVGLFLDRDGTLMEDVPYNLDLKKIRLTPYGKFLSSGLGGRCTYVAVVTNQPLIARGLGKLSEVLALNQFLSKLLGPENIISEFFICPHHPDSGFEYEVSELKIPCACRKPEVSLFLKAAERGGIFLTNAIVVGDSECDIYSAIRVGAKWIHVHGVENSNLDSCNFRYFFNGVCAAPKDFYRKAINLYDSF